MTPLLSATNVGQSKSPPASATTQRSMGLSRRTWAGIALVVAAAVLYGLTLDNGLQESELFGGDLITHQYAQVQARPSNAPGYPLYTMGGWLWFHGLRAVLEAAGQEHANPVPILSSYSTLWALLALWLLYEIVCLTTASERRPLGNWPVALLVSGFYAVTYFFWYYATTTEQYSSAIAQTLGIVLLFLIWLRRRESLWLLYALAFLCGLSLAHMLTVALVVPPVVGAVLWAKPELLRSPKTVMGSIAAALLPLVSYAYVYGRGSRHPEWWGGQAYASANEWFWVFVSTAQGREELLWAFEPGRPFLGNGFPELVGQELTWAMVMAGLGGIAFLKRPMPFVLYATLALYLVFSWAYRFGNWFQVILPAYALLLVGVGALAGVWQDWIHKHVERGNMPGGRGAASVLAALPLLLLAVAVVWRFNSSYIAADSRNRHGDDAFDRAATLLAAPLPPGAALFAPVEEALALQYLAAVWGLRPDVHVVSSDQAGDLIEGQPVWATWDAAATLAEEIGDGRNLSLDVASPDWVSVRTVSSAGSDAESLSVGGAQFVEVGEQMTPEIQLAGYAVRPAPDGRPVVRDQDAAVDVTLFWKVAGGVWPGDVAISVRPTLDNHFVLDTRNPPAVLQSDHSAPAQLLFGGDWQAGGEALADPYRIRVPEDPGAQEPGIAVILYRRAGDGFEDAARVDLPLPAGASF